MTFSKYMTVFLILFFVLYLVSIAHASLCEKSAKEHPWDEVTSDQPVIFFA